MSMNRSGTVIEGKKVRCVILVEPIGKGRPRSRIIKKGDKSVINTYTPKETRLAEAIIINHIRQHLPDFQFPQGMPLRMDLTLYRQRPQSTPKRVTIPTTKPDWDNSSKLLCDALESYLYYNDSQLSDVRVRKRFGSPPRIEFTIEEDPGE
jgi:Holliday junction resolvase RusA-like endonuclease